MYCSHIHFSLALRCRPACCREFIEVMMIEGRSICVMNNGFHSQTHNMQLCKCYLSVYKTSGWVQTETLYSKISIKYSTQIECHIQSLSHKFFRILCCLNCVIIMVSSELYNLFFYFPRVDYFLFF